MPHVNDEYADDLILPDDWEEGEDIFADVADTDEGPTTDPVDEGTESDDADDENVIDNEEPPTTEPEQDPQPQKAKIKVKYNHEERELDEDEAAPLIQKGLNYDKKVKEAEEIQKRLAKAEALSKRMGYQTPEEMLEAAETNLFNQRVADLVDQGVHEAIAKDLVQREWERVAPAPQVDQTQVERDKDLDEFVRLNPGVTKLPNEVIEAVGQGVPLTVAYERFKNKQAQEELKILKQNQASAAKAPVAPTTKHGAAASKPKDDFEAGFDSDDW